MKSVYQGASNRESMTTQVSNLPSRNSGIWSELTRHVVVLAINSVNVTRTIKKRKPVITFHGIIIIIIIIIINLYSANIIFVLCHLAIL